MDNYRQALMGLNGLHKNELLNILDAELSLPNIPLPTMGGEVFWNDIAEYNGWRIQQNMITQHARILNADNVRIAWGTLSGMEKALSRMADCMKKYSEPEVTSEERMNAMQELKQLKELLDIGAITQAEFEDKKKKLMRRI